MKSRRLYASSLLSLISSSAAQGAGTYTALPATISPNPSNVTTFLYLPPSLAANPPLVVVPHWCHGSAADAFAGSGFTALADTHGFPVIYPDSPNTFDKCWDVASDFTLAHDGGGDSTGIISAVKYVVDWFNVDTRRIFAQGTSSGAMMTNVLLGAYPDIFAAGSDWAGVMFGCYGVGAPAGTAAVDFWNDACATGQVSQTGAQWAAGVHAAFPAYAGWRPKIQCFHGTEDNVVFPPNLEEQVKGWPAVLGLSATPSDTLANTPIANWTMRVFNDASGSPKFEATFAGGIDHNIQTQWQTVFDWFDLECTEDCFGRPDEGLGQKNSRTRRRMERARRWGQ